MDSINFMGSYSGIDRTMIDKLMEAEKVPLIAFAKKKTNIAEQQNAWKDVNMRMNSLFEKIKDLQSSDVYESKNVSSTNRNIVSIEAGKSASAASYDVKVSSLATATRIVGSKTSIENSKAELGLIGSFDIGNDEGKSITVTLESTDSLSTIMDKINDGSDDTGVKATIVDNRLVIKDTKLGVRNITIGGGSLTLEAIGLSTEKEETKGTDSLFTVNGIEITRDTNRISDAINGVVINLNGIHEDGSTDKLTVSDNTAKTESAIRAFVEQYNSTLSFIDSKMNVGTPGEARTRGDLAGDSTLKRLQSTLRQMVSSPVRGNDGTTIGSLSELGITTIDRHGALEIDSKMLTEKIEGNVENVKNFFSNNIDTENEIGFSHKLNGYIDSFISKTNGIIKGKSDSFESNLKYIDKQIKNFNTRMIRKEQYYIKTFSALDVAMMQAESQMDWLSGQISAMNATGKK